MRAVTQRLSEFVSRTQLADIPADVQHQAKRTLLNYFGCACGGCGHEAVEAVIGAKGPWSGPVVSTVIGRNLAYDPCLAALLNGMSSAVYSFDDTHRDAIVHPGGPVASAVLALTQETTVTGADLLLAFILGAEIVCRVSKAISVPPAQVRQEWVQTGICAGIGAAAACARLLALTARETTSAIGIASCRSSGFRGLSRSMCFSYMAGSAAEAGLSSAQLAKAGMVGPEEPLDGKQGYCAAFSNAPDMEYLTSDLGVRYELLNNTFKPYPCGVVIHPVIDACLVLADSVPNPGGIAKIRIKVNPAVERLSNMPEPKDQFEAQTSLQHWAACAFLDRAASIQQTTDEKLQSAEIAALRRLVEIETDPAIPRSGAAVVVDLQSGDTFAEKVLDCRGSANLPLTDAEIEAKFNAQAVPILGPKNARKLAQACWVVETLSDASVLMQFAEGAKECR